MQSIGGYALAPFACWYGLQCYLDDHAYVYYKAPLDFSPVIVTVTKRFKNGKLRLAWAHGSFTADPGHLDRFLYKD